MTAALEGDEWSAARPDCALPPGRTRYPFYRRLRGPQDGSGRAENQVPTGIRSLTVQPVVSRYTDGATRPTTEMGTRNILWGGKPGRCLGMTPLPPSRTDRLKIWDPQPPGNLRVCPGLYLDFFTFIFMNSSWTLRLSSLISAARNKR